MLLRPALANEDEQTVDRGQLLDAVRRVRINADSESSALVLDLEPGVLTVRSKDKSGNQATEDLDVGWSKGTRQVVINHAFLTDMVSAMPTGSTCHFKLGTDGKRRQRPAVMLTQPGSETVGLMSQMRASWVTE
jgi:DNA polymerase III sliding clamp (beta) subunit (PCNA family)